MENLTLMMKIAKPHTIDPLEGHTVVIFENVGNAGEEFRFEIAPGQTAPVAKRTIFEVIRGRKPPTYFAYAVTGMPELRWQFTADVTLDIQTHTFTLLVTLTYSVSEPRILVTRRNDDPIRQVRDHVIALLARQFAQRTWAEVLQNFRDVERIVVASIVPLAQQYASQFGINVHDVELNHRLSTEDVDRLLNVERVKMNEEAKRVGLIATDQTQELQESLEDERTVRGLERLVARRALDVRVANIGREDQLADSYAKTMARVIENVGARAETAGDIRELLKIRGWEETPLVESGPNHGRRAVTAGESGPSSTVAVIAEALETTERIGLSRSQKQQLQSAILHVIAEIILNAEGAEGMIERYAAQIDEIRHELKVSREHADYLKQFVQFETLRDALR